MNLLKTIHGIFKRKNIEPVKEKSFYETVREIDEILKDDSQETVPVDNSGFVIFSCSCGKGGKVKVEDTTNIKSITWKCPIKGCLGEISRSVQIV